MSEYVFGRNAVLELLETGKVETLFVQKGELKGSIEKIIGKAKANRIVIKHVDKNKLDNMTGGMSHQGVVGVALKYEYFEVDDLLEDAYSKNQDPFIVILDEIEDPHNLGAIIRTAEVAGANGIIIPKRRSATVNSVVHKSSAGATNYLKVAKVTNISQTIDYLKSKNIFVYGTDGEAKDYYNKTDLTGPIAIVIGNEGKGMSRLVKEKCDVLIKIPMYGKINSLNASNASAVIIYEIVRQRDEKK
ncbi:23S rRNA (guanosine(2251)-2'-O)-methyltransferase RlmB [Miniphocaeibacter massiliensis]|uniref:23S rRNA (guanosine(2251)-2'-O)-methyltransferase RlmB n=1 Tax=Miniphocaeibacter massiliensis TaxID=2041841 RepID=UPI000C06BECC|nr:23S rRNA (guanosine(2251)-2'-O)-methyltransferase RlmB [Miniphocaeibacter massiliensis]